MMKNGLYIVFKKNTNEDGLDYPVKIGSFEILNDRVTEVSGEIVRDILKEGPITPLSIYKIKVSLNNGYIYTEHVDAANGQTS